MNTWDLRYNKKMFEPDPFPGLYVANLFMNYIPTAIYKTSNKEQMNEFKKEFYDKDNDPDDPKKYRSNTRNDNAGNHSAR